MSDLITVDSEYFGMTFYFDDDNDLMYAPSLIDGGYDKDCEGYVHEWDDFDGCNYRELFAIIRELTLLNRIKEVNETVTQSYMYNNKELFNK